MIDDSEVRRLVVDLNKAAAKVQAAGYGVMRHAAVNIKADWARQWTGITGIPHIARSITYDINLAGLRAIEVEVGPDPDRVQGKLDNIVEFGSSEHGPIRPVTKNVLETEAGNVERVLRELGDPL